MEHDHLQEIYRQYGRQLYLYLLALCRSHPLAEDLTQEAFARAMVSLPDAHPNFKAWLFMVGRNLYFKHQAKQRRTTAVAQMDEMPATGQEDLLAQLVAREEYRRLYRAMESLVPMQRQVLVLQYFGGMPQKDIAQVLGLTHGNVRLLAHRAKQVLKQQLEGEQ